MEHNAEKDPKKSPLRATVEWPLALGGWRRRKKAAVAEELATQASAPRYRVEEEKVEESPGWEGEDIAVPMLLALGALGSEEPACGEVRK